MTKAIDENFSLDSDKYNFILREKKRGKKEILHFFPTLELMSNFIAGYRLREFIPKGKVNLINKSTETPSYDSVIEESARRLEQYIDSLVSQDDSKR
ncbi:hypothetical protein OAV81_03780 [Candidatus Thioglobus sp.]|jgi:hypothetical protein|nr:hypothetical protein [Candidatus Thioglobus sp.]